jgi:abequosyltransferase
MIKISVCIPAYNRSNVLPELLDSILQQSCPSFEILICEDHSPEREDIRKVVANYKDRNEANIRYIENDKNLGFDGNLRKLIELAEGDYCMFMGNDDLMAEGALLAVSNCIERHENIGVLIRSYASFNNSPDNIDQVFRYFPTEVFFNKGSQAVVSAFRRCVVIPGVVIKVDLAKSISTSRFDGTLLYQLYLVGNILMNSNAVFLPDIITLYRNNGVPEFGNAEAEKSVFVPGNRTIESSVGFVRGMLDVAFDLDQNHDFAVYDAIVSDIGNYSYPILSIQREKGILAFIKYWRALGRLGLANNKYFNIYFLCLLIFGERLSDTLIRGIKRIYGSTPRLGGI